MHLHIVFEYKPDVPDAENVFGVNAPLQMWNLRAVGETARRMKSHLWRTSV